MYYLFLKKDEIFDCAVALQRFFKYVLKTKLIFIDQLSLPEVNNGIIFIFENERDEREFLEFTLGNRSIKIIVMCFGEYPGRINLFDLNNYRKNFQECLNDEYNYGNLFSKEELRERFSKFMASHGKESIVSILNQMRYVMNNYSLVLNGIIDIYDYKENFLMPVLNKWYFTKNRMDTYTPYFIFAGCVDELNLITVQLEIINNCISHFKSDTFKTLAQNNSAVVESVIKALGEIQVVLDQFIEKIGLTNVN